MLASRTKIFIVLELVTGGELFDKIVAEGKLSEGTARAYFRQLLKGLKYCHTQGVCHRDLKPENLLLDANGLLKISDFGLSAIYTGSETDEGRATLLHTTCGTPNYVAPEVLADKGYNGYAADIWSAGVILYVLMAGYLPFDEQHMSKLFAKIQKAEYSFPAWFTAPAKSLIAQILVPDPMRRVTLADIEADPWFVGPDNYHDDNNPFSHGPPKAMLTAPVHAAAAAGASGGSSGGGGGASSSSSAPSTPAGGSGGGAGGGGSSASGDADKRLVHVPSAKDIEDAVGSLSDEHVADDHATSPGSGLPPALNAFDVVNMLGGIELGRMMEAGGPDKRVVQASPQFLSAAPAATLMSRLAAALSALKATVTVDEASCKVLGKVVTGRGEISLVCDIYRMGDGAMHLAEIRRGRGDILEFHALAKQVREAVSDLAVTPSKPGGGGAAASPGGK